MVMAVVKLLDAAISSKTSFIRAPPHHKTDTWISRKAQGSAARRAATSPRSSGGSFHHTAVHTTNVSHSRTYNQRTHSHIQPYVQPTYSHYLGESI